MVPANLPLLSGYCKTDTLQVTRTHDYSEVYGTGLLDSRNFVLTLPLEDVSIAGFFGSSVYEEYFAPEGADGQEVKIEAATPAS